MTRARELANLADDTSGLETLTVSDITDLTATATELNYTDGVGSAIQTQINAKANKSGDTFTGNVIVNKAGTATEPTMRVTSALESSSGINSHGFSATFLNTSNNANAHGVAIGSKHADSNSLIIGQHDTTFDHFVVKGDGKVGVGTNDPKSQLNISDSGGFTTFIVTDPTRNASGEHWYLRNTGGNFYIGQATDSSGAWDSLQARVTFEDGGYVGIGTTNPESSLEVYGGNNTASSITLRNTAPNPDSHWQITPLYDSDTLAFRSANNSYANRMTIQGDGVVNIPGQLKVGVFGAVAPLALLHHASSLTTGTNNLTQINSRTGVIYINSGHASYIPFYARGGGGVAWNITWLDSDNGSWTTSNSFSYTESGSTPNTYTLDMTSGGGMLSIARTGGSREYQVWVLSRVFL